ncbi:BCP inhibitor precursor [Bombyx mori]|uniref:BCP inhibitor n=1 Tax=Bombyx mori TaxID=7091 RepID=Q9XZP6_BOMMO|nr:BCP inhibitor precursor [Bombyx mori]CAB41937.1 BCP inhibitor [Bombyx mori]
MNFVSVALLIATVVMASSAETDTPRHYDLNQAKELFEIFVKEHNREYKDDADRELHYQSFKKHLAEINQLNEKNPYTTFGINKFADYTPEEQQSRLGLRLPAKKT